jgi:hypothetical protein
MLLNSRHEHEPALIPVMAAVSKLKSTIKHRQNG